MCFCGTLHLWQHNVFTIENSQHLTDWYTFSHILHGILAYALITAIAPASVLGIRAVWAVSSAVAWELIENSNFIIARFRIVTISEHYIGDSIVNAIADVVAMGLGFYLARFLPIYLTVLLALVLEGSMMFFIRDGLGLSTLMLLWPVETIRNWQLGG